MVGYLLVAILFGAPALANPWSQPWARNQADHGLKVLLSEVSATPLGAQLIQEATRKMGVATPEELIQNLILPGETSHLSTSLRRSVKDDQIIYQVDKQLFINRYLNKVDAVMDLAHELVHFTKKPDFNPYENAGSLEDYILAGIEGQGGEADAFWGECQVYFQLTNRLSNIPFNGRCERLRHQSEAQARQKIIRSFFAVGPTGLSSLAALVGNGSVLVSKANTEKGFMSSVGSAPYPIALAQEYQEMMNVACQNNTRRLASGVPLPHEGFSKIQAFVSSYCRQ